MKTLVLCPETTWGDWIYGIVRKQFKQVIKHKTAVLDDSDPESLHQMRVGLRRLGSALQIFAPAIALPKGAQIRQVRKVGRVLGTVRDLDVLRQTLAENYRPQLPAQEAQHLDTVLIRSQQQRRRAFTKMGKMLQGDPYRNFKRSFKTWLKEPAYNRVAELPLAAVWPDLLLPTISQLLLHPGWLVGTDGAGGNPDDGRSGSLSPTEEEAFLLHDLRKQIKRVRYQSEFFRDCCPPTYATHIAEFATLQGLLGQMQDSVVMVDFLIAAVGPDFARMLPTLTQLLGHSYQQAWETWTSLQNPYLTIAFRDALRQEVAQASAP